MSHNPDPEAIRIFEAAFRKNRRAEPDTPLAIFQHLCGTGKRAAIIDIPHDPPGCPSFELTAAAVSEYYAAVTCVRPIGEVRQALLNTASAISREQQARNPLLAEQMRLIAERVGTSRVGAVLGALHYGALDGFGSSSEASKQALTSRIDGFFGPKAQLYRDVASGVTPDNTTLDRIILNDYRKDWIWKNLFTKSVEDMSDEEVSALLTEIDTYRPQPKPMRGPLKGLRQFLKDML